MEKLYEGEVVDDASLEKKFKIKMTNPLQQIVQNGKIVLCRHGLSKYNYQSIEQKFNQREQNSQQFSEQYEMEAVLILHLQPQFFDSPLHEIGVKQAINGQKFANAINFKIIYISPLLRAIETCYHMLATHPNRKNIIFKVFPLAAEDLSCSCNITLETTQAIRQKFEALPDMRFDFSEFDKLEYPLLWQVQQLQDSEKKDTLMKELVGIKNDKQQIANKILQYMHKLYPNVLEDHALTFKRSELFKKHLQCYLQAQPLKEDERIGVYSHVTYIQCLTAKGINKETGFADGLMIANCQLVQLDI